MSPSEIGLLLVIIIIGVAISIMIKGQGVKEGFANKPVSKNENFPNITFCPFNSTPVITNAGESLCCKGETSLKLGCLQKTVCSLSNSSGKNYGPCSKVYGEYIKKMSRSCPKSLPSYFEKRDPKNKDIIAEKGCYAGPTHPSKYEPVSSQQKRCLLYQSKKDSELNINSCLNQKNLDAWNEQLKTQGGGTAKFVYFRPNTPPLIQITQMKKQQVFGGVVEMPEITYTWASLTRYWKYVWPEYVKFNLNDFTAAQLMFVYEISFGLKRLFIKPGDKKLFSSYLRHRDYWV